MTNVRKLEDLNLIDDFLFQEMLVQEQDGEEFCRILLRTILGKELRNIKIIPQKSIPGINTDCHGIRMDAYIQELPSELCLPNAFLSDAEVTANIYDIEPNNTYEKGSLPKRMRYYNALIDTQLLQKGADYGLLPSVTTIIILPYDPFGSSRMVYTVQNQCIEDPTLPYDDGTRKIFLYTKGTKDIPSQKLRDMLNYIENSVDENVTNQDIATIHNLVTKVKHLPEVGINYMKSWEREDFIRKEAKQEGISEGIAEGKLSGQNDMRLLIKKLSEQGRADDILKLADDETLCQKLMQEFDIQ